MRAAPRIAGWSARASPTCRRASARTSIRPCRWFENIDFFGRLFGAGRARARAGAFAEIAGQHRPRPLLDRPAGKLSGGMKQKLSLCCALDPRSGSARSSTSRPPASILSRAGSSGNSSTGSAASSAGMSVMVATAYMEEAARFDWLMAMDAGRCPGHRHAGRAARRGPGRGDPRRCVHRAAAGGEAKRASPKSSSRRARRSSR